MVLSQSSAASIGAANPDVRFVETGAARSRTVTDFAQRRGGQTGRASTSLSFPSILALHTVMTFIAWFGRGPGLYILLVPDPGRGSAERMLARQRQSAPTERKARPRSLVLCTPVSPSSRRRTPARNGASGGCRSAKRKMDCQSSPTAKTRTSGCGPSAPSPALRGLPRDVLNPSTRICRNGLT